MPLLRILPSSSTPLGPDLYDYGVQQIDVSPCGRFVLVVFDSWSSVEIFSLEETASGASMQWVARCLPHPSLKEGGSVLRVQFQPCGTAFWCRFVLAAPDDSGSPLAASPPRPRHARISLFSGRIIDEITHRPKFSSAASYYFICASPCAVAFAGATSHIVAALSGPCSDSNFGDSAHCMVDFFSVSATEGLAATPFRSVTFTGPDTWNAAFSNDSSFFAVLTFSTCNLIHVASGGARVIKPPGTQLIAGLCWISSSNTVAAAPAGGGIEIVFFAGEDRRVDMVQLPSAADCTLDEKQFSALEIPTTTLFQMPQHTMRGSIYALSILRRWKSETPLIVLQCDMGIKLVEARVGGKEVIPNGGDNHRSIKLIEEACCCVTASPTGSTFLFSDGNSVECSKIEFS